MTARLDTRRRAPGAARRQAGPLAAVRRNWLVWPRLPAAAELATIAAGYAAYVLVRLALPAGHRAAFVHAAQLWHAERWLHLNAEPYLNHLASACPALAVVIGYYYGLLHFIVTALVLAWLYLRRPAAFPRLRSALVLVTTGANIVFWTWPVAPPRFSVPGMTDILVRHDILGAASPGGAARLVNLYAAMPSLHVAWATWCALAVVSATLSPWRHLAWLYPAATIFVVLASANHFVLDASAGLAIALLSMAVTRGRVQRAGPGAELDLRLDRAAAGSPATRADDTSVAHPAALAPGPPGRQ